ncbi:DUF1194 domain-containing protein [Segnochrobactraceae bacterium EtOH-i3]
MRHVTVFLKRLGRALSCAAALFLSLPAGPSLAADQEVDVELVLAVDISQSMDEDEQDVQRRGYVSAIVSEEVGQAIQEGLIGRIAVTYVEWGGSDDQRVVAPWHLIDGPAAARAFAEEIRAAPLRTVQRTSISSALAFSSGLFEANGFAGQRRVIDMSGDGPNNQGTHVRLARDMTIARGITINGLPLMLKGPNDWYAVPDLDLYYQDCVIGGPGAFLIPVRSLESFAASIRRKLVLEIAGRDVVAETLPASGRKPAECGLYE